MYPAVLTVSSDGPAGTAWSTKMGIYKKETSQEYNDRPVYIVLIRGGQFLFFNGDGYWCIGPKPSGVKAGGGISTVMTIVWQ